MTSTNIVFPKPHLTPFPSELPPNAPIVQLLSKELYANAAAITSSQGGGAHGHLGLVMSAADYAAIPGTAAWVDPVNPGALAGAAVGGTAAAVAIQADAHRVATVNFHTFV